MYCKKCGTTLTDGERFCHKCGAQVESYEDWDIPQTVSDSETPQTQPDETGVQQTKDIEEKETETTEQGTEDYDTEQVDLGEEPGKKRPSKDMIATVAIIAAVIIVVFVMLSRAVSERWTAQQEEAPEIEEPEEEIIEMEEPEEPVDIVYEVDELTEQQQNMLGPMQSLIYTNLAASLDEKITLHWASDEEEWGPIDDLINDWGETYAEEGDDVRTDGEDSFLVSGDFLKECASALYADFDGILPEIPASLTTSGYGVEEKDGDDFRFRINTWGEQNWSCRILSWTEHPDDTQTVEVGVYASSILLNEYQFDLVENAYTDGQENPYFVYSVSNMVKINDGDAEDNEYILPESNTRYYSEEELKDFDQPDLDKARDEIYARHGMIFNDRSYFNNQTWYEGTVKEADFSDDILNAYEKGNIETIIKVGGWRGDESITDSDANFRESWDIIQEYGFYDYAHLYKDDTEYTYSNLFFRLYPESVEDKGDYIFARALFCKPIMVPANLKLGDKVTICTDELEGTTEELTCVEVSEGQSYLSEGDDGYTRYRCDNTGKDSMTMIYKYDIYGRPSCPFYNGILRIRKDAITGSTILLQGYDTASTEVLMADSGFYDAASFDEDGYVTQLIYTGE